MISIGEIALYIERIELDFIHISEYFMCNLISYHFSGGWNAGSKKFSQMAADPAKRQIFLDSIIPFVQKYGFEGVDMDWEYPGARDTIDEDGDKENFSVLVKMMGELLHEHNLLFTAALSPGNL